MSADADARHGCDALLDVWISLPINNQSGTECLASSRGADLYQCRGWRRDNLAGLRHFPHGEYNDDDVRIGKRGEVQISSVLADNCTQQ